MNLNPVKNPAKTNPARKNNQAPTKRSTTTTLQDPFAPPPQLIRKKRVFGTTRCPNIPSKPSTVDKPATKPKIPAKKSTETGAARSKLESETNNNRRKDREKISAPVLPRKNPASLVRVVKVTQSEDGPSTPTGPPTVQRSLPESETNSNLSKDKEKLSDLDQVVNETSSIDGPPLCPPTVLRSHPESETNILSKVKDQVVKETQSIDGPPTPSGPPLCPTMVPDPQTNNNLTKDKEKISAPPVRKKPASLDRVVKVTGFEDGPSTPSRRPLCPATIKAPRVRVEGTPTPFHTARNYRKTRFEDELETASYWLAQIRTAEAVGKHSVSASFFRLAAECKAEPEGGLRAELKRYLKRHQHLRSEVEWNLTCQTYGLITVKDDDGGGVR